MWDFLEEVDVISKWGEQQSHVTSTAWKERKEALEALVNIIEKNPRLSTATMTVYGSLIDDLRMILKKDSNVQVVMAALRVLALVADGLREKFNSFILMVLPSILEKAKDKKAPVRSHVGSALDSISAWCDPVKITKDVTESLQKATSPEMKQTICVFLYRYFKTREHPPIDLFKAILPTVVKLAIDPDPATREAACSAIGSAKRLLGGAIESFLGPLNGDKSKLEKIESACNKATEEWKEMQASRGLISAPSRVEDGSEEQTTTPAITSTPVAIDPWTMKEAQNLMEKVPTNWTQLLASEKWQERKDLVDVIAKELETEPRLTREGGLVELVTSLAKTLENDKNVNVATGAAKSLAGIASGLRHDFAPFSSKILAISFERMKDKTPALRKALVALCDLTTFTAKSSNFTEAVTAGLQNKNPQSRAQTCLFISRLILKHDRQTFPAADFKDWNPVILKCCADGDAQVRESALQIVASTSRNLGEGVIPVFYSEVHSDGIKMKKVEELLAKMKAEEETQPLPPAPHPIFKKMYEEDQNGVRVAAQKTSTKETKPPAPTFKARPVPNMPAPVVRSTAKRSSVSSTPQKTAPTPILTKFTAPSARPTPRSTPVKAAPTPVKTAPAPAKTAPTNRPITAPTTVRRALVTAQPVQPATARPSSSAAVPVRVSSSGIPSRPVTSRIPRAPTSSTITGIRRPGFSSRGVSPSPHP